ncbi:cilia- and flagella-associated protein 91 isoform X2 [Nelusetta ayraudi]
MFSGLPHYPWYTLDVHTTDPVPAFVDRSWQGCKDERKEALHQLAGIFPSAPSRKKTECYVTGADYWKYFKRPQFSAEEQNPFSEMFSLPPEDLLSSGGNMANQATHYSVGVQTDYRESETQTDPYSPAYVIRDGTTPSELLQLAAFTWGQGLPAGLAEVEIIQHARAQRALEATLPPLNDLSQVDRRRQIIEEMCLNEWAFREKQVQKMKDVRLAVLKDLYWRRTQAQDRATNKRLDLLCTQLQEELDVKRQKNHHNYYRVLRKLGAKWRNVEGKLDRPGVVLRYVNSKTSNPRNQRRVYIEKSSRPDDYKSFYLDTPEGLLLLERRLLASALKPRVKRPRVSSVPSEVNYPSRDDDDSGKRKELVVKKEKPVPRPGTPRVDEPAEGEEERELAVIYLQKLLRGRSIQCKMFKAKENHLNLIQEVRTENALQKAEQQLLRDDIQLVKTLTEQRDSARHEASLQEETRAAAVSAELEHLFDALSKGLIHLQEERRIHAFTLLAERDRRMREAEESGRRQEEERILREGDEIFRQVVQIHQETVDLYLEDVILETVERTADEQAREEVRKKVKEVNDIAYALEESQSSLQSQEIVSELVYSFLIPEIEKIRVRQRVHQRQRVHLQAAQSIINGLAENPGNLPGTQEIPQSSGPLGNRDRSSGGGAGQDTSNAATESEPAEE